MIFTPEHHYLIEAEPGLPLFHDPAQCRSFLVDFSEQLGDLFHIQAYALIPGELRLLVQLCHEEDCENHLKSLGLIKKDFRLYDEAGSYMLISTLLSNKLTRFFKSKWFSKPWIHSPIDQADLASAIVGTHQLPVNKGLCTNINDWQFSSYAAFLSDKATRLPRAKIIQLFGSAQVFEKHHQREF